MKFTICWCVYLLLYLYIAWGHQGDSCLLSWEHCLSKSYYLKFYMSLVVFLCLYSLSNNYCRCSLFGPWLQTEKFSVQYLPKKNKGKLCFQNVFFLLLARLQQIHYHLYGKEDIKEQPNFKNTNFTITSDAATYLYRPNDSNYWLNKQKVIC